MAKHGIVNELHKPARKNFSRRSVVLKKIDDLWQADLIDIQTLKSYNSGHKFILVVIDCFSKFAWAVPLKSKNKKEVSVAFTRVLNETNRHPINLHTDRGTEFYNSTFSDITKSFQINHYSTFSTKKASIVERLIRTLKSKIYKKFSFNGNYKWVGRVLNDVVKEYNSSIHRTTRFRPIDVTLANESIVKKNIDSSINKIKKKCKRKFEIGDFVRVSKYKNCFSKSYTPNWSTEIFTIKKVKNTKPITYYLHDKRNQPISGAFYEQELQKSLYPNVYLIGKVIKKKNNKMYVKWLGFDKSENSWIDVKSVC